MTTETKSSIAAYDIRKWFFQIEETLKNESRVPANGEPLRKIAIGAAIRNPYAGSYSENLDGIVENSDALGFEFGRRLRTLIGDAAIESYGKACLVGVAGEYEHGNAFLTQYAADPIRKAIGGGKAWVPSTGKVGPAGSSIDIPLAYKDALYVRSHYDTITATFTDAPRPDEVVIIWAFATRGRLHARLGGLDATDVKGIDGLS